MNTEFPSPRAARLSPWTDRAALIVVSVALFLPSLHIGFVSDNVEHIVQAAQSLHDISFQYYRPLTVLTFLIDRAVWGMHAFGFHLTNLLLHLIAIMLLYELVVRLLNRRLAAFAAALLFAVHPIHSMSIFWLTGRVDILCTIFYLLSLLALVPYHGRLSPRDLVVSLLAFVAALLSKEMALSLPFIVAVFAILFGPQEHPGRIRYAIAISWPYFAVAAAFLLFRFAVAGQSALQSTVHSDIAPLHLARNLAVYLGLMVVPAGHIEIAAYLRSHPAIFASAVIAALIACSLFAVRFRKSPAALFFTLFALLTLLPVIRHVARWYLYLPSAGLCALLAMLFTHPFRKQAYRIAARSTLVVIVLVFAGSLVSYQSRWRDASALAERTSTEIVTAISDQHLSRACLLTVPAELGQTPVLMFGLDDYLRWRATEIGLSIPSANVSPIVYLSLGDDDDFALCRVDVHDDTTYTVFAGDNSAIEFPTSADIVSGMRTLRPGDNLSDSSYDIRIEQLDNVGRVTSVSVHLHDPDVPVLYYGSGRLTSNLTPTAP